MRLIDTIAALEALYDPPTPASLTKVARHLTPLYRAWIGSARFCILTTVGPDGTDASPRGDDGPVVRIMDDRTLWLPDWRGNNRLDALRNIVVDGRVSLLFMVPGYTNVVRVNGHAGVTDDRAATESFAQQGRHPQGRDRRDIGRGLFPMRQIHHALKAMVRCRCQRGAAQRGAVAQGKNARP